MPQANSHTITPALPRALPQAARRKVEAAVEAHLAAVAALTAFLDEADGDTDLEPSLAGTGGDDREYDPADPPAHEGIDDNELDGPASIDDEPELGWPAMINQDHALKSCASSYVTDPGCPHGYSYVWDGGEPSLGATENIDQTGWGRGESLDREAEHDGREPEDGI
jgi:hypothetical protein